jgi:hypothetical protein
LPNPISTTVAKGTPFRQVSVARDGGRRRVLLSG